MALMKHRGLFELLEKHGQYLLDSKFQSNNTELTPVAAVATKLAIETMLEELAPNLWEDDLDRLVDFGHLISPELEMVRIIVEPALLDYNTYSNRARAWQSANGRQENK